MSAPPLLHVDARAQAGALRLDARFDAGPGTTVLFGPSASGKTLLLRVVLGLVRPDEGIVRFGGALLDDGQQTFVRPEARRFGYAPQDAALWPHRTVRDHLTPFAGPERVHEVLGELGLTHLAGRRPARLSGGERQRLAIARAVVHRPDVLLLDEPLSALHEDERVRLGDAIKREAARRSAVVLFVTHDAAEARRLGDAFVRFDAGAARGATSLAPGDPGAA